MARTFGELIDELLAVCSVLEEQVNEEDVDRHDLFLYDPVDLDRVDRVVRESLFVHHGSRTRGRHHWHLRFHIRYPVMSEEAAAVEEVGEGTRNYVREAQ